EARLRPAGAVAANPADVRRRLSRARARRARAARNAAARRRRARDPRGADGIRAGSRVRAVDDESSDARARGCDLPRRRPADPGARRARVVRAVPLRGRLTAQARRKATHGTSLFDMTSSSRVSADTSATPERSDFIREIVAADVREGRVSEVVTRFPP